MDIRQRTAAARISDKSCKGNFVMDIQAESVD